MADKTALQESSQALFCAISDYLGLDQSKKIFNLDVYPTYDDFKASNKKLIKTSFERIESPGVKLSDIENFLSVNNDKKSEWYKSSVYIAKKLIEDITEIDKDFAIAKPNFEGLYYFRGDKDIMNNIALLFKAAKSNTDWNKLTNQAPLGDINKWSPADIYLGSNNAKKIIKEDVDKSKNKSYIFTDLNKLISNLIDTGDLLPLSLKKAGKDVKIVKVNFDSKYKKQLLSNIEFSYFSQGTKATAKKNSWSKIPKVSWDRQKHKPSKEVPSRDIIMFLSTPPDITKIQLRHDPSSGGRGGSFKVDVGGNQARGGSIASFKIFTQILSFVDKNFASQLLKEYERATLQFIKEMEKRKFYPGQKGRDTLVNGYTNKGKIDVKLGKKAYDFERGQISAQTILNSVMPMLSNWLSSQKKSVLNNLASLLFEYITSRTQLSSKFVIAK